ncbi:ABC transporter permease [Rhodobium gokarnense]|uniref:Ribose transport system permease protein n=1 Tax=Rhodobium gokarnense TaxID=364296 RepID=A0ABT3HF10_9HYPH|nr:ABC transporter permease [Rhodobium gokarnense]MCW2308991.1 ribose transport system permease protein [Rhodobium gokarnense]
MPYKGNHMERLIRGASKINIQENIVYFAFVIVVIFFAFTLGDRFLSVVNILNIARQTAIISIMAVAMTFVIASGQIDLSVGSIAALSSLVVALCLRETDSVILSVLVGLFVGVLIGGTNGILATKVGVPAFLVTLGMMGIAKGLAMWITNTMAVPIMDKDYNVIFGLGTVAGIPILLIWTAVVLIAGVFVMHQTPFGKKILAVGGNETGARYSGINVERVKMLAMCLTGAAAAFAGILYAGRMQAGRFTFGEGDELTVIAAVVLGGTNLYGGTARVVGAVVGSLLIGVINNGLIILGLSVSQQIIVRGMIVILAAALGLSARKR